jgi:antitoxin (DNA-binding transcriptional repressor) of toxin-antitoxin stability system
MKTATVRDLRYDFPKIEAMLRHGEEILITKHNRPFATLLKPKSEAKKALPPLPDFKARLKKIWGDRVFSAQEVEEMRAFETGEP